MSPVVISPSEKTLPARLNLELVDHLQKIDAPDVFTPPAAYDGRKNMFAPRELPLGPSGSQEVCDVLHSYCRLFNRFLPQLEVQCLLVR